MRPKEEMLRSMTHPPGMDAAMDAAIEAQRARLESLLKELDSKLLDPSASVPVDFQSDDPEDASSSAQARTFLGSVFHLDLLLRPRLWWDRIASVQVPAAEADTLASASAVTVAVLGTLALGYGVYRIAQHHRNTAQAVRKMRDDSQ
jgi:Tfp pilus assembly protein FimV